MCRLGAQKPRIPKNPSPVCGSGSIVEEHGNRSGIVFWKKAKMFRRRFADALGTRQSAIFGVKLTLVMKKIRNLGISELNLKGGELYALCGDFSGQVYSR